MLNSCVPVHFCIVNDEDSLDKFLKSYLRSHIPQ